MAVVIETTLGDITVDLYVEQRPRASQNFLKLCKLKYYNFNLFHSIRSNFIAQTGDPTGEGSGGTSVWGVLEGPEKRYFACEKLPKIRHTDAGLLSMVVVDDTMVGSQFFFTLAPNLDSLDNKHCVIGEVVEGHDILRKLNEVICDETHRPYRDVRITHTVILEDPFNDMPGLRAPSRSPSPSVERLAGGRIAPDEEINETKGKTAAEVVEMIQEKEAKARATILEIVGDLPDAEMAPPENVLFVCKLNPVTTDEDLEIIFSRFGRIVGCEVIRDKKTGDSLQYAFIEFEDKKSCENAYFKMDNVLIDDRRIHVDFSQSVSKLKWRGKGKGVIHVENEEGDQNGNDKFKNNEHKSNTSQRRRNSRDEYRHSEHDSSRSNNRNHSDNHKDSQSSRSSRDNREDKMKESDRRQYSNNENRDKHNHKHRRRESPHPPNKNDSDRYGNHSSERKLTSKNSGITDHKKYSSSKSQDDERDKRSKGSRNHSNNSEKSRSRHDNGVDRSNKKYDKSHRSKHSEMQRKDPSCRSETPPPPPRDKYKDSSKGVNKKEGKKVKEKPKKKEHKVKKSKKHVTSSSSSDSSDDSSSSSSDSSDSDKKKKSKARKRKRKHSTSSSSTSSSSSSDSSSTGESSSSSSDSSDSDIKCSKKKKHVKKSKNVKKKK